MKVISIAHMFGDLLPESGNLDGLKRVYLAKIMMDMGNYRTQEKSRVFFPRINRVLGYRLT